MYSNLAVKTHTQLIGHNFPELASFIQDHYDKYGLKDTITCCARLADYVIAAHNETGGFEYDNHSESALLFHGQGHTVLQLLKLDGSAHALEQALQVLRFLKRFGYPDDTSDFAGIMDINHAHMVEQERVCSSYNSSVINPLVPMRYRYFDTYAWNAGYSIPGRLSWDILPELPHHEWNLSYMERTLLDYASALLNDVLTQVANDMDWYDAHFSNGVSYEKDSTYAQKVTRLTQYMSFAYDPMYPFMYTYYCKDTRKPHAARLSAVPKDYKSKRIVAPEPTFINFKGRVFRRALERFFDTLDNVVPYDDQTVQQARIMDGSLAHYWNGLGFCSIDLSGASDSIPAWQLMYAAPKFYEDFLKWIRAATLDVGRTTFTSYILLTSGNAITWIFESLWFLCLCLAGMAWQDLITGRYKTYRVSSFTQILHRYSGKIGVYGDDIACDSEYYDAIISTFSILGYTVNTRKSFSGYFAESCGCDSYKGVEVTSIYWPRTTLKWNPKASWRKGDNAQAIASLCSLQHRLYGDYPEAAHVVEEHVLRLAPSMTYSRPGTPSDDLWGTKLARLVPAPSDVKIPSEKLSLPPAEDQAVTLTQAWTRHVHKKLMTRLPSATSPLMPDIPRDTQMYLYVRWLRARAYNPNPESSYPCFTWINGVRYDSILDSFRASDTILTDGEVSYEDTRE
jgi:hypothetical protein